MAVWIFWATGHRLFSFSGRQCIGYSDFLGDSASAFQIFWATVHRLFRFCRRHANRVYFFWATHKITVLFVGDTRKPVDDTGCALKLCCCTVLKCANFVPDNGLDKCCTEQFFSPARERVQLRRHLNPRTTVIQH